MADAAGAQNTKKGAFTLIELLVVIAIIALLVALLTPSMRMVKYLTRLSTCGSNVRQLCYGATSWATSHRQRYPDRGALGGSWKPTDVKAGAYDERQLLRPFISMDVFMDPLSPPAPINHSTAAYVESSYGLWYGWGYNGQPPENRNHRIGQGFVHDGRRYHVLASDWLTMVYYIPGIETSHPDADGILSTATWDSGTFCISRWQVWGWPEMSCGEMDMNFGFDDGSVRRLNHIEVPGDPRTAEVPEFTNGSMRSTVYVPVVAPLPAE